MMAYILLRGLLRYLGVRATKTSTSLGIQLRSRFPWIMSKTATPVEPETAALAEAGSFLNTRWIPCPKIRVSTPLHDQRLEPCFRASLCRFKLRKPRRAFLSSQSGLSGLEMHMTNACRGWGCFCDWSVRWHHFMEVWWIVAVTLTTDIRRLDVVVRT